MNKRPRLEGEAMNEDDLRRLIDAVRLGKLSRRRFNGIMASVGVTAPLAGQLLAWSGVATAQAGLRLQASEARRRRRAEDAVVAGPDAAQSALWVGRKDLDAARIFYEPLAALDPDGQPGADPRGGDTEPAERRRRARRPVGDVEAQAQRQLA